MIKIENIDTWGFEHAIRGMRNPKNSWDKSESKYIATGEHYEDIFYVQTLPYIIYASELNHYHLLRI